MSQATARRGGRQIRKQPKNSNLPLIIGSVVVALLVIAVLVYVVGNRSPSLNIVQVPEMVSSPHIDSLEAQHAAYNSNPPTSGPHVGSTAPSGVLTSPLPDELTVHNLEHGFVIIHYRADLDANTVSQLTDEARTLQAMNSCVILLPRAADKMPSPIALTAWNNRMELQSFDASSITAFFKQRVGRGPEQICSASVR